MNYKNNLLTKKKYKIVNQKAGSMTYWLLCVNFPDYLFNRFTIDYLENSRVIRFPPFNIKIGKYSWLGGVGGYHYSINDSSGTQIYYKKNETEFVAMLMDKRKYKKELEDIGLLPSSLSETDYHKNMCVLYHMAFLEGCVPPEFIDLQKAVLNGIKNEFLIRYNKQITEKKRLEENIRMLEQEKNVNQMKAAFDSDPVSWDKELLLTSGISRNELLKIFYFRDPAGIETMSRMTEIADKYTKNEPFTEKCLEEQSNNYCDVFFVDMATGAPITPFQYKDDKEHEKHVKKATANRSKK